MREGWDGQVTAHHGSLLQSWDWGALQESLGRKLVRVTEPRFLASVVEYPLPLRKKYWYVPHGPVFTHAPSAETLRAFAEELRAKAPRSAIFLKIEPPLTATPEHEAVLRAAGWKRAKDTQPSETLIIDLTKPEPELLREMEHDTRYAVRAAERRGVKVHVARTPDEKAHAFAAFWDLFEATNVRHELHAYDKRYYEAVAKLHGDCYTEIVSAWIGDEVVASAIIAYFGKHAYYLYAASRAGFGKFNAPSLILWEVIRHAKQKFCTVFDLWGISNAKKEWAGVTAFKKSFGGKETRTVGTWEYPIRPLWRWAYNAAKRFV
jgi:lipid II:glycine glycyltransferase (peptidoglycan interpeptide bridge formation enzyme)